MRPVEFPEQTTVYAKNQPQYNPLPAYMDPRDPEGRVISCWKLSWKERLVVLFTGRVYFACLTFGQKLQPLKAGVTFEEAL